MTREKLVEEKRRLVRVQSGVLKAAKLVTPDTGYAELVDAVGQLSIIVGELLKEHEEK